MHAFSKAKQGENKERQRGKKKKKKRKNPAKILEIAPGVKVFAIVY